MLVAWKREIELGETATARVRFLCTCEARIKEPPERWCGKPHDYQDVASLIGSATLAYGKWSVPQLNL